MRRLSCLDRLLDRVDTALRAGTRTGLRQRRATPGETLPDPPLAARDRRHAGALMRVNHAGEVCAQALYVGQAMLARDAETWSALVGAAAEEGDHLYWCEQRLRELGSRPSYLDGFWFAGSFAIGMAAAAAGDRWSLGFVEETERQVVRHLEGHLARLAAEDIRSRAVVQAMQDDEARHADGAARRGAAPLPRAVKTWMRLNARVMTTVAYWI
jgi:ubiquinone biosynthesis monooxygenase Coq7